MPDFTVDIGGITTWVKNWAVRARTSTTPPAGWKYWGPKPPRSDELDEACADFQDSWAAGLGELREAIDEIRDGLDKAIAGYRDLENTIRDNLRRVEHAVTAAGDSV